MEQYHRTQEGFNLRLESRLKNADLVRAREKLKLKVREAAMAIGINYNSLLGFESMRIYPSKDTQKKICDFYRNKGAFLYEEDVFPESLRQIKPKGKFIHEARVSDEKLLAITSDSDPRLLTDKSPDKELILNERIKSLYEAISTLPEKHQLLIKNRYLEGNPKNLDEIAGMWNVTRSRVGQMELDAIEKLREKLIAMDSISVLQNINQIKSFPELELYEQRRKEKIESENRLRTKIYSYFENNYHVRETLFRRFGIDYASRRSVNQIAKELKVSLEEAKAFMEEGIAGLKERLREENYEKSLEYLLELLS